MNWTFDSLFFFLFFPFFLYADILLKQEAYDIPYKVNACINAKFSQICLHKIKLNLWLSRR